MDQSEIDTNTTGRCVILDANASVPWNNPNNLISFETVLLFNRLKYCFIPILYFFGGPVNIINMIAFYKLGLKERINVCLFCQSLVDFIYLSFLFVIYVEQFYTQFTGNMEHFSSVFVYSVNNNILGLVGFGWGTILLSAVISTERCICVLFPLRAQRCISVKLFTIILVMAILVISFLRFFVSAKYRTTCFYEEAVDRMTIRMGASVFYIRNKFTVNIIDRVVYGMSLAFGCPAIVFITTVITVIKLQQTVRWRNQTTCAVSHKEIGVTKMLICLSIEFLILSIPKLVLRLTGFFDPGFNMFAFHANIFQTFVGFAELSSYVSSSVNFFVFYFIGSKYRAMLHTIFCQKLLSKGQK